MSWHSSLSLLLTRASKVPSSTTLPSFKTMIRFANLRDAGRCEIKSNPLLLIPSEFPSRQAFTASATALSPSASMDEFGSSNMRRDGSESKARASAILCL
eukprot:499417_1